MAKKNEKKSRKAGRSTERRERRLQSKRVNVHELDARVTESIVQSALAIGERSGFDGLTVESIATYSGVAKTTIYRRWPDVCSIVSHAFFKEAKLAAPIEQCSTARESLRASMRNLANTLNGRFGKMLCFLIAQAQNDDDVRRALRTEWFKPRRQLAGAILRSGINSGELRADLDVDIALDVLVGSLYQRVLEAGADPMPTEPHIDSLLDAIFAGLAPPGDG
ncbi:MAG: TetR/AcrR family transcriptional regulator C-terminal ligand-binding domain-containing protein [Paraburkholderia sp.]|uniref:TetR/AcrR family transcriptional regulator n=1 Tax=Burkholderiaceae TaxID=119060 RepID=UPI0010F83232|nr:TetR/AcrR family transcriptional regulator [Burkholderia sp. 4M9327F10]